MRITDYQAKYFAFELTKRCPSDSVEKFTSTLMDAQVDLNPHQIDAALFAFNSPLSKGALLADEVGLGKTIEAGIVLSQKWAERKKRILIICPAAIRKQWSQELSDKFYLPSLIMESKTFNEVKKSGSQNPIHQDDAIIICSYQFARTKSQLVKSIAWDLVVIDEAHRLRNVYKSDNKIGRAIKEAITDRHKLLLTATPLQNSLMELYGLVSFIDEHAFGDSNSFKAKYSKVTGDDQFHELKRRLAPICKRTLRRQVLQYIKYTNRVAMREEFVPSEEEQHLYDLITNYLLRGKLHALPRGQRQLITLVLRKLLASSTFAIAGALDSIILRLKKTLHMKIRKVELEGDLSDNLESIEELVEEWNEGNDDETPPTKEDIQAIQEEILELESFRNLAVSIMNNAKGQKLIDALTTGFKKMQELKASPKALIFTESRRTQDYLVRLLSNTPHKDHLVLFNGSNNDERSLAIYRKWLERNKNTDRVTNSKTADMRAALVEYFRDEASIMIATKAAAEGVNLQFCSLVINYDLPWNPQRIEQRIGRCHRYGQNFDVVVVNFINKNNAADQRVYELLEEKFKLFSGVFGASDEVLGVNDSGLDFEKKILKIYQECRTQEQITKAFDDLQRELETEITEEVRRTRQQILEELDEEVQEKLRVRQTTSEGYLSKYEEWLWILSQHFLAPYADFHERQHRFILRQNPFPKQIIPLGEYKLGKPIELSHNFRISNTLAQHILETYRTKTLNPVEITFDYSSHPTKISSLECFIGKTGYLRLDLLTLEALEIDDYLIFSAASVDNDCLGNEECRRLFSLRGTVTNTVVDDKTAQSLHRIYDEHKASILKDVNERNSSLFDEELEKLDKWAEDRKLSLEVTLNDLDDEIRTLKKQIRLSVNLPEKIALQKKAVTLEKKRTLAWKDYDKAQSDIERDKDALIEQIESKLSQKLIEQNLFRIRWKLV